MPGRERVVVVEGCRTPFARSGTELAEMSAYQLGCAAVSGLLHRTRVDPATVELLVMGTVIADPATSNLGREVVLGSGLPERCPAHTVTMACVSSLQAFADAFRSIVCGEAAVAVAAGAETLSDAPIRFRRPVRKRLIAAQKAKRPGDYLRVLRGLSPRDLLPEAPALAEFSTGEVMGENAERLAKRLRLRREDQDAYALRSHRLAAAAAENGWLDRQVVPLLALPACRLVERDNGIRADSSPEKLASLPGVFDRTFGSVTAGNSSFLTDGGAAVLLMAGDAAERSKVAGGATVRAVATAAAGPREELLLGPAYAIPKVLDAAGLTLDDVGVVELHEAFAAQVLAVQAMLSDDGFARTRLGRSRAVGAISLDRLNAWGGSLAVGHPFGATGARLLATCLHRMEHEGARFGLVAACAAGALGIAAILERR